MWNPPLSGSSRHLFNWRQIDPAGTQIVYTSHLASLNGHVKNCAFLVEHGADPTAQTGMGWTPLHLASLQRTCRNCAFSLLSMAQIRQPSTRMGGPLCIWRRRTDMSKLCISLLSMAQIRQPEQGWADPFASASQNGHVKIVHFLVEHGADRQPRTRMG